MNSASGCCGSPELRPRHGHVDFPANWRQDRAVLELIVLIVRAIPLACRGHEDIVLENIALRHQLWTLQRAARPRLRPRDRIFWVLLASAWRRWRSALVLVQPETVV
jgi:hypothetical protein